MRWILLVSLLMAQHHSTPWGFYAHKNINHIAVFSLPYELFLYYKPHIDRITEWAVRADQRRYAIPEEGARHFIDIDQYELELPIDTLPRYYDSACSKYGEEMIQEHGILPYHFMRMTYQLTHAMQEHDLQRVIRTSADLGHYIADAHVPLHTTRNYNGQLTGQHGIHGLWESRLPELYWNDYDLLLEEASYIPDLRQFIWEVIEQSHEYKDDVLLLESSIDDDLIAYSYEDRNGATIKVYSRPYCDAYERLMDGMVEERVRSSIHSIASVWYTCWVNAGQPELIPGILQMPEIHPSDSSGSRHTDERSVLH